jgi:hypothetical protein
MNLLSIGIKWWHEAGVMVDCWECWYWAADFAHTSLLFAQAQSHRCCGYSNALVNPA